MEPVGPPALHPAFIHQSDDSDEDDEDILGLGNDDGDQADGDGDVEGEYDAEGAEAEAEDDDFEEDFLAADLRESDTSEPSNTPQAAPVATSAVRPPAFSARSAPSIRPPPSIVQHRATPPAPPPGRPVSLSQLAGGGA